MCQLKMKNNHQRIKIVCGSSGQVFSFVPVLHYVPTSLPLSTSNSIAQLNGADMTSWLSEISLEYDAKQSSKILTKQILAFKFSESSYSLSRLSRIFDQTSTESLLKVDALLRKDFLFLDKSLIYSGEIFPVGRHHQTRTVRR